MKKLEGRHVLVTGGSMGIGAACVRDAAENGARVSFVDINIEAGQAFAAQMRSEGFEVEFAEGNVADFENLKKGIDSLIAKFGDVYGLVNNAGVNSYADPVEMTDEQWDAFFNVDLKGMWLAAKLTIPGMKRAKKGAIVNVSSIHGRLAYYNFFPYSAAKHAVIGMTRNLGVDLGSQGIRVNAVSPGYIMTPLAQSWYDLDPTRYPEAIAKQPMGRVGEAHEVAKVVSFLLSDDSSFVNASDWAIDGAFGARMA